MIIQGQHIQKYYGAELVLQDVTFEVKEGERVGLVGRNGTGKTTLLRLLTGEHTPDQGQIMIPKDAVVASLAQIPDYGLEETVLGVLRSPYQRLIEAWQEMRGLEEEMSLLSGTGNEEQQMLDSLLQRYGRLQELYDQGNGYSMDSEIDRVAAGIGIPRTYFDRPFSSLSGGEKTKVGLAVILLQHPDLLLLDEPTNHLDMAAIEWLEDFLRAYEGTVIVVSHDRYFLDAVVQKIIELEDGEAFTYHCSYSRYKEEKESRLLQQFADYQEQQKKIKKMQETIKQLIEWGNRSNPPNAGFHRRAASMQKALDRMVKLKRPILERKRMDLQLDHSDRSGKDAIILHELSHSVADRQLYQGINQTLRYGERAVLIGGNGTGKSTLMKSLLGLIQPDQGEARLGARVQPGYLAQESAPAEETGSVLDYFRRELGMETGEARGQLARFLFYGSDVFKKVQSLSGGEWTRLRLAMLMYRQPNLLLLDEPTNHLDIESREALEETLEEYPGTLLAISHDRYFINKVAGLIWSLADGSMTVTPGDYDDYRAERARRATGAAAANAAASVAGAGASARAQQSPGKPNRAAGAETALPRSAADARGKAVNPAAVQRLEQEIAAAEAELAAVDAAMLEPHNARDAGRLSKLLTERECCSDRLDQLLERYCSLLDEEK